MKAIISKLKIAVPQTRQTKNAELRQAYIISNPRNAVEQLANRRNECNLQTGLVHKFLIFFFRLRHGDKAKPSKSRQLINADMTQETAMSLQLDTVTI